MKRRSDSGIDIENSHHSQIRPGSGRNGHPFHESLAFIQIIILIVVAGITLLAVLRFDTLLSMAGELITMLKPFIIGAAMAFVLNLPLKFLEERLLAKNVGKLNKYKRILSIVLSLLFFAGILAFVIITVIPQMAKTFTQLTQKIPIFIENAFNYAELLLADNPQAVKYIENLEYQSLNWEGILSKAAGFLKNGVGSLLSSTVTMAGSFLGGVVNGVISFIFSIYILTQKEVLKDQGKRVLTAYLKEKTRKRVLYVGELLYKNFSNFITGQCMEAVILGILFIVVMSIFRMPYAFMVGVLIGFTALIPIVGAFIGCFVGAFMIMVEDPVKALAFIVLFLIIQQVEGNLIYPKVVGNSVGLPSIWVLLAVTLGSSMFGVVGMLVFIPLFSTLYTLVREDVNRRNNYRTSNRGMRRKNCGIKEKR